MCYFGKKKSELFRKKRTKTIFRWLRLRLWAMEFSLLIWALWILNWPDLSRPRPFWFLLGLIWFTVSRALFKKIYRLILKYRILIVLSMHMILQNNINTYFTYCIWQCHKYLPEPGPNKLRQPVRLDATLIRVPIGYVYVDIVSESKAYRIYEVVILII
jgi:hypothetical protein